MNAICTFYEQNTFLVWAFIIISLIGLLEVIGKFISIAHKKTIMSDYSKHLQSIFNHLEGLKTFEEVRADYGYVMNNYSEMLDCLSQNYNALMNFYYGIYHQTADEWTQKLRITQIHDDFNREDYLYRKQIKEYLVYLFCPTLKFYRGLCTIFKIVTIPIRQFWANFDRSGKIETSVSILVELLTLTRVCIELYNILH